MTDYIKQARDLGVIIPEVIIKKDIRGVYGFFEVDKDNNTTVCLYIGRSYNIRERLFGSKGHFTRYFYEQEQGDKLNDKDKYLVPRFIRSCLEKGKTLEIRVLKKVAYKGDNYYRDMQRLAYAELREIEKAQKRGECLNQLPEGTWISEDTWNKNFKK